MIAMNPSEYARELCLQAAQLLRQAELTHEGLWMQDAIECYVQALEADPECLEPCLALAWLWLWQGQPEPARFFLSRAQVLAPFDQAVHELWQQFEDVLQQELSP